MRWQRGLALALLLLLASAASAEATPRFLLGFGMGPEPRVSGLPARDPKAMPGVPFSARDIMGVRIGDLEITGVFVGQSLAGDTNSSLMVVRGDFKWLFGRGVLAKGWEAYLRGGLGHAWGMGISHPCSAGCANNLQRQDHHGGAWAGAAGLSFSTHGPIGLTAFAELERQFVKLGPQESRLDLTVSAYTVGIMMTIRMGR